MNHVDEKNGFTLIELMLAMVFVSALLLMVAAVTIQISNIYNRGLLLKADNEAANKIISDLQQQFNASEPFAVTDHSRYITSTAGGRLCMGSYSYVWNYGKALDGGSSDLNYYSDGSAIRFVRVRDSGGNYCASPNSKIPINDATELLDGSNLQLVLYNFSLTSDTYDSLTGQRLYNISFTLGTLGNGDDMDYSGVGVPSCKVPSEVGADSSYCYVNVFNLVARSGGRV